MTPDPLRRAWLARRLRPAHILLFARIRSTNRTAAERIEQGRLAAPALIAAALQTKGIGRHSNSWWSDSGSLCATFVFPAVAGMPVGQIPLRAGLAVAAVLRRHLPRRRVAVKWPNDILVDDKKIAGVLCRRLRDADLIGIGLNVRTNLRRAPDTVRARATSLAAHTRQVPRRDELLAELWTALAAARRSDDWRTSYRALHTHDDRRIRVDAEGDLIEGICRGIDCEGRLLIEHGDTLHRVTSASVLAG